MKPAFMLLALTMALHPIERRCRQVLAANMFEFDLFRRHQIALLEPAYHLPIEHIRGHDKNGVPPMKPDPEITGTQEI